MSNRAKDNILEKIRKALDSPVPLAFSGSGATE
jgi:hypothetical protein